MSMQHVLEELSEAEASVLGEHCEASEQLRVRPGCS